MRARVKQGLRVSNDIEVPDSEPDFKANRAQGSAGQNVINVSSAVQLRLDVAASQASQVLPKGATVFVRGVVDARGARRASAARAQDIPDDGSAPDFARFTACQCGAVGTLDRLHSIPGGVEIVGWGSFPGRTWDSAWVLAAAWAAPSEGTASLPPGP